jgi:hypothetical protein
MDMARRALLVGVNDYANAHNLNGCVNDVLDMHFTLRSLFGFGTEEIRVVTDSRATRQGILDRLQWLVKGAQAKDFLVFHFSGHGSQIRDRDGDELTDRLDEMICPHDVDFEGNYITDDELNAVFKKVPAGALLEVILDCCHSGTGLRDVGLCFTESSEHPTRNRFLIPPPDIMLRSSGEEDRLKHRGFMKGFKGRNKKHHILWAASRPDQTAADAYIDGRYHGAFSYFFNKHLRRDPEVSRKELLKKVRATLVHNGYTQVPQLELEATKAEKKAFVGR